MYVGNILGIVARFYTTTIDGVNEPFLNPTFTYLCLCICLSQQLSLAYQPTSTTYHIYNEAIEFRFRIQDFCQVHHARLLLSSLSPSPPLRILLAKSGRGHLISNFIQVGFRLACKYVKVIATVSFMISSNLSKPTLTLAFHDPNSREIL